VAPGDWLFLLNPQGRLFKLRVEAVFPSESELVSADLVVLSEADFRAFHNLPEGVFTDLALGVRNPREITKIVEKAALVLPDCRFITRRDILRTYDALFDWREGILLALMAGAILAFMILAWDKASGQSPEERREIGILKAIGWETGEVIRARLWESALVSLFAFLAGYLLAYLHVFTFSAGLLRPVLQGWAVLYPEIHLTPRIDGARVLTLFLLTVGPYVAATLVPIWRAAVVDPDTVMR
jgi:ABC-type lipoprotein release transport system permease subunit